MKANAIRDISDTKDLEKGLIERTTPDTIRANEGSVNVEEGENGLHGTEILRQVAQPF
jgi:hypothetical protein